MLAPFNFQGIITDCSQNVASADRGNGPDIIYESAGGAVTHGGEGRHPYACNQRQDSRTCGVGRLPRCLQSLAKTTYCPCEPAACRIDADCSNGDVADAGDSGLD